MPADEVLPQRPCPTCDVALIEVPEKPAQGTCLVHGVFEFRDRIALD